MTAHPCTGRTAFSGSDRVDRRCPNDAARLVTAGCAHEHVGDHDLCHMHAAEARAGIMLCGSCLDASREAHRCRLNVISDAGITENGDQQ